MQLAARSVQLTNVRPCDIRHRDKAFALRGRLIFFEGQHEVGPVMQRGASWTGVKRAG